MENLTKYEMEMMVNYNVGEQAVTIYMSDKFAIGNVLNSMPWGDF